MTASSFNSPAIDLFIGNEGYLSKGFATRTLREFNFHEYNNVLVTTEIDNIAAIKTYEKSGFIEIKKQNNEIWMIKKLS